MEEILYRGLGVSHFDPIHKRGWLEEVDFEGKAEARHGEQ